MSTDADDELVANGVPELTPLGKRIELLRIERRMSKRVLAQRAGTSRQQLWRVMTGKSELTSSLCARLSEVLETDSRLLRDASRLSAEDEHPLRRISGIVPPAGRLNDGPVTRSNRDGDEAAERFCETLEDYVSSTSGLERTFETLPPTEDGRRLKRVLLDAIEDIAMSRSLKLPQAIFDLRRAIVNADDQYNH
jgi:transcriptional regulator with XRE-family HTH domain